jgi:hypothetical protein
MTLLSNVQTVLLMRYHVEEQTAGRTHCEFSSCSLSGMLLVFMHLLAMHANGGSAEHCPGAVQSDGQC